MDPITRRLLSSLERCAHCGKCRSVCPVFDQTVDEKMVARGRITIMEAWLRGTLGSSRDLESLWKTCIKCARCSHCCPSGALGDEIAMAGAAILAERSPNPLLATFFGTVVPNRPAFDAFIRAAAASQALMRPAAGGTLRHLPLAIMGTTLMPTLAPRSALSILPSVSRPQGEKKARVGLFVGCAINYVYPQTAKSTVKLLTSMGVEVVTPRGQLCCGTPMLTTGYAKAAATVARRNAQVFGKAGLDAVITPCASCALTLTRNYPVLGIRDFPPVFELSTWLAKNGFEPAQKLPTRVAWHDPCHLRYGLGIHREPRTVLSAAADLVDMPDEDKCCGGGGTFAYFNPELSEKLAAIKVRGASESEAEAVVTGCPGCVLQLRVKFAEAGLDKPVIHIADLLANGDPK